MPHACLRPRRRAPPEQRRPVLGLGPWRAGWAAALPDGTVCMTPTRDASRLPCAGTPGARPAWS
eukprot:393198-Lingulodinium_polyedra.AAC.1